jgi:uncharacterized protein YrrD
VIRMSQLKGQRVLALDGAQIVGNVRRLLLDPASDSVVALQLDGTSDAGSIVDWSDLAAVGPDALMVDSDEVRRGPLNVTEQQFVAGNLELAGKLVLTDTGDAIGELTDLSFEEETGKVVELEVPGHALPLTTIVALGPYSLIVAASG